MLGSGLPSALWLLGSTIVAVLMKRFNSWSCSS